MNDASHVNMAADGTNEAKQPRRRSRWVRRGLFLAVLTLVVLLALWNGVIWRWFPRVETFEPEPGCATDEPFTPVFAELAANSPADVDALRRRADQLLAATLVRLVDKQYVAPSGDAGDYVSLSIYWWLNPLTRLPYLHSDGRKNPEANHYDAPKLSRLIYEVETLAAASAATGDTRYGNGAMVRLSTWFVDIETRMSPHLTFAQMMPGWAAGGRQGIIEGIPLATRLPDALARLGRVPKSARHASTQMDDFVGNLSW